MVSTLHSTEPPSASLKHAEELKSARETEKAIALYKDILSKPHANNDDIQREQEFALVQLGELYKDLG